MAKKKKRRSAKPTTKSGQIAPGESKQSAPKPKKRSKYPLLALAVGVALLITGIYFLSQKEKPQKPPPEVTALKKKNIRLRERKPTLPPQRFVGKVRKAYTIARVIPEVLDRLYCYCRCRENVGHKNLLSCFADTHAST